MIIKTNKCPECGYEEYSNENYLGEGFRLCKCGQEWWTDINYSKTERK